VSLPSAQKSSGPAITTVAVAHPLPATVTRFALPAMLLLGGLALLAGSCALIGAEPGQRLRRLARFPRGPVRGGSAGSRPGPRRKP
jgi:hypothetical protein